jgi:hypothetical protein
MRPAKDSGNRGQVQEPYQVQLDSARQKDGISTVIYGRVQSLFLFDPECEKKGEEEIAFLISKPKE